jgi:hypothetical protein
VALLDFGGDYGADVRPPRVTGDGRKPWAKDPSGPSATDGTRIDATLLNDLVALIRATLSAFSVAGNPGDDSALASAISAAISAAVGELGIDALAPKDSPTFTGTPTAPTAATDDNSTALATTEFVAAAVAALVNASPATLDTLKELADALGDDPNFATTITAALGLKAPLASPALTGNPTAPTPTVGDNSQALATTAFVAAAVAAISTGVSSFKTRTGAVTPANDDYAVTMLQAIAANSFVGNNTAAAARPIVLTVAQVKALLAYVKGDVGLGNVDNTADSAKPVSSAQQTALNAKMGLPDVIVEDQKASGSDGGAFTSGARRTRTLNTLVRNNGSLASLASNLLTLPAGSYFAMWDAPAGTVDPHQSFLVNATDGTDIKAGTSEYAKAANGVRNRSFGSAVFTLAAAKALSVQHQCTTTNSTDGFGTGGGFGTEVYTRLQIWKLS